ncbi:MAG: hypothetical protein AAF590_12695 [Pseudomonadota bacterium]
MKPFAASLALSSLLVLGACQSLSPSEDEIALCKDEILRLASVTLGETPFGYNINSANGSRNVTINFAETANAPGFTCNIDPDGTKRILMFQTLTEPLQNPA